MSISTSLLRHGPQILHASDSVISPPDGGQPRFAELPKGDAKDFTPEQWNSVFDVLTKYSDEYGILSRVARAINITKSGLGKRFAARNTSKSRPGPVPRLGVELEDMLIDWLDKRDKIHAGPTKAEFIEKARALAKMVNAAPVGGPDWYKGFFARHPAWSERRGQLTESARFTAVSRPSMARYFQLLSGVLQGVAPDRIWNVDEVGIDMVKAGDKVRRQLTGTDFAVHSSPPHACPTLLHSFR